MATDQDFIDYVLEQSGLAGELTYKRMFGEFGFYLDGRFIAVAADNMLFLKPTEAVRALLPTVTEGRPYPEARPWFLVDEALDDPELLRRLLQATAAELPPQAAKSAVAAGPSPRGRHPRR